MSWDSYSETGGNPNNYTRCFLNTEKQLTETQCETEHLYQKFCCVSCYFARQGLPFRRHGIDSIFKQLLNFPREDDLAFAEWLKKEVISTLPWNLKWNAVLEAIKHPDYHSIMIDESSDVSN